MKLHIKDSDMWQTIGFTLVNGTVVNVRELNSMYFITLCSNVASATLITTIIILVVKKRRKEKRLRVQKEGLIILAEGDK